MAHTPTPWTLNKYDEPAGPHGDNIRVKGFALTSSDEARANSALIVRAVNSHEALVEALRKAEQLASVASDWNLPEVEIDGQMVSIYVLMAEFRAALSTAESGK